MDSVHYHTGDKLVHLSFLRNTIYKISLNLSGVQHLF